jgi:hypothetical protein
MIALLCFVLAVLAAPCNSKSRLEAENAALRHQLIVLPGWLTNAEGSGTEIARCLRWLGRAARLRRFQRPYDRLRMAGKVESLQIFWRAWLVIASFPRVVRDEE